MKLFHALEAALGKLPIIAEDLGVITDKVRALLEESGFPGMKVLIFGFDVWNDNEHLPHNYKQNSIVYTSTHDSQSVCEQIMDLSQRRRKAVRLPLSAYLPKRGVGLERHQECLGIPGEHHHDHHAGRPFARRRRAHERPLDARRSNWAWRVRKEGVNPEVARMLREITETYKRYKPYQKRVKRASPTAG